MPAPTRAGSVLTSFAGALAGALLGGWLVRTEVAGPGPAASLAAAGPPPPARLLTAPAGAAATGPCAAPALAAESRKALAEEIAVLVRENLPAPPAQEPASAPVTPEALAARDEAELIVHAALSTRRWTDQDALALRSVLPRLAGRDHDALLLPLIRAINDGQLAVLTEGPPF